LANRLPGKWQTLVERSCGKIHLVEVRVGEPVPCRCICGIDSKCLLVQFYRLREGRLRELATDLTSLQEKRVGPRGRFPTSRYLIEQSDLQFRDHRPGDLVLHREYICHLP